MAQRAQVPKFGNWESEDDVPYTVFFEKARRGRGGKMINPNDPRENPEFFANIASSDPAPAPPPRTKARAEEPIGRRGGAAVGRPPNNERRVSRDEGRGGVMDSPGRNNNMGRRTSGDQSAHQLYCRGTNSTRASRRSVGSESSIERSALHPHYQAKVRGGGGCSPSGDDKNSVENGNGSGTPGRSLVKPRTEGDEAPHKGAAVPRFGDWDENNPQSAENFTHVFNKVRKERHNGPSNVSGSRSAESSHHNLHKQNDKQPKDCCLPWFSKCTSKF